mgnify:CR=1 FL=1
MKKKQKTILGCCRDAALIGTYLLAEKGIAKLKQRKQQGALTEEQFQKRMTALTVVYHLMGIIYNE